MKQRKSPRICQNCGKPITGKESASIFAVDKECGEFCSGECMTKKLKKNLREMQKGNNMACKCAVCGKHRASGRVIAPHEKLPEVKKEVFVCSQKCEDTFIRRIISGRKKAFRKQLEHKTEPATEEDYGRIWSTLTPKEQKYLAMIGFGYLRTLSDKTPAGFYKELHAMKNK